MSLLVATLRQTRYDLRAFRRNPAAAFFTIVFPLMFLVIFNAVFGDDGIAVQGGYVDVSTFYVPAILALAVIGACYTNLAMAITFQRDSGVLKRVHGTPLPPLAFILGRILQATVIAALLVILVLILGALAYGVELPGRTMPAFVVTLVIGAICFCALGLAISSFVPNADAAPAVVNASIMPLLFISDVFIPTSDSPAWIRDLASLFPVSHFASAMHTAFSPFGTGSGFEVKGLAVMAAWGVLGVLVAVRFFRWEPKR